MDGWMVWEVWMVWTEHLTVEKDILRLRHPLQINSVLFTKPSSNANAILILLVFPLLHCIALDAF